MISVAVDILPRHYSLLLNKFVLFGKALSFLVFDLLLAVLSLIVALFSYAVQVVLHDLFLPADFVNGLQFVLSKVLVANQNLLFLPLPAAQRICPVGLSFLSLLVLLPLPLEHLVVVLLLQVLQLARLLAGLLNLLNGAHLLVLQHPHTVSQLLNVALQLQTDRTGLVVGQVLTFNIDYDVGARAKVATLVGVSKATALALAKRVDRGGLSR